MRDPQAARISALEAEVAQLRAENARLKNGGGKGLSPIVVLKLARRGVRPWLAIAMVGIAAWLGYVLA